MLSWYYGGSSDLFVRVHLANSSGEKVWATLVGTSRYDGVTDQALPLYYSASVPLQVPRPYELSLGSSKQRVLIYEWDSYQLTGVLLRGKEGPTRRLQLQVKHPSEDYYTNKPVKIVIPGLANLEPVLTARNVKQPKFWIKVWSITIIGYLLPVGLVIAFMRRNRRRKPDRPTL